MNDVADAARDAMQVHITQFVRDGWELRSCSTDPPEAVLVMRQPQTTIILGRGIVRQDSGTRLVSRRVWVGDDGTIRWEDRSGPRPVAMQTA